MELAREEEVLGLDGHVQDLASLLKDGCSSVHFRCQRTERRMAGVGRVKRHATLFAAVLTTFRGGM